jgi:hypothetical protein
MSKLIPTEAEVAEFLSGTKSDGEVRLVESRSFGVQEIARAFAVPDTERLKAAVLGYDLGAHGDNGVGRVLPSNALTFTTKR